MRSNPLRLSTQFVSVVLVAALAGCASPKHRAPVEDRSTGAVKAPQPVNAAPVVSAPAEVKQLAGAENAGKPGFYTVKPGDSLIRIALDHGQNWRDLVRWNSLDNPNLIEVGQVLRVVSPSIDAAAVAAKPVVPSKIESRPLDSRPAQVSAANAGAASAPSSASAPGTAASSAPVRAPDTDLQWAWPSAGPVVAGFDERQNNMGLDLGGKAGDPVYAAADGRAIFVGSHRGYGNMIIIKHNEQYLTAYAHNQTLLVKEEQVIRRGQKIAEMGSSDSDRVKLHFEVRRNGKPLDPAKVLPTR